VICAAVFYAERLCDAWPKQLGTLSGNPVAAVAGLRTLDVLARDGQDDRVRANGARLRAITRDAPAATTGISGAGRRRRRR
jgi:4-aminobutyrate aminotransferase-like enzyme